MKKIIAPLIILPLILILSPPVTALVGQPPDIDLELDLGINPNSMRVKHSSKLRALGMKRVHRGDKIVIIPAGDGDFTVKDEKTGEELKNIR